MMATEKAVIPYDMVVFGATGFTGSYVVAELMRVYEEERVTWAVAGRSDKKLAKVLEDHQATGVADVVVADVDDFPSLVEMCKNARVVLDCVGPYRMYGEPVVKACAETGTGYVDICGEPQFLENMQLKYHEIAQRHHALIVGACGFDSIPSDLGVVFTKRRFQGVLSGITCYLDMQSGSAGSGIHFGTYESAVYGLGDESSLRKIRRAFGHEPLPLVGPKLKLKGALHYNNDLGKYASPFPGADAAVVKRSQRFMHEELHELPVQYTMYFCIQNLWSVLMLAIFGALFKFLAHRSWGRNLLLRHPKFFTRGTVSHEGPSKQQLEGSSFSLTMHGVGYETYSADDASRRPDKTITVRVAGPEAGYIATPIFMVQSALVMLKEPQNLPENGGVLAPGAAFCRTSLIERLQKRGIVFKVVEEN